MAKKGDKRIDEFRDRGMDFITRHFEDMEEAMEAFKRDGNHDKAVNLYLKLVDKVIPSLPTQAVEIGGNEKSAWQQKIDKAKKTYEKDTK